MKQIVDSVEKKLEDLNKERQDRIEKIIEECTLQRFERVAEIKGDYDFLIKKLESAKNKNVDKIKQK